jgi:hypothetical protein
MPSNDDSQSQSAGTLVVKYYKPRDPGIEITHVQREGHWENYSLSGLVVARSKRKIPGDYLARFEEIDETEARQRLPVEAFAKPATEFQPCFWRYCLPVLAWVVMFVALEVVASLRRGESDWSYLLGIPIVFSVIGLFISWQTFPRSAIRVSEGEVTGPVYWWPAQTSASRAPRRSIPLEELDRQRSSRRSRMDRLLGRQRLLSADGEWVLLNRWAFARRDVRAILSLLGVEGENLESAAPRS